MDISISSAAELESITTKEEAKTINPINRDAVHRICSGQVVLSLAIAVKELVENSLDSGATVVEVRLKEYGEELVEVLDNGSGVTEDNFTGLTLKYHTSKLRDFSDLLGVTTFGFRGEALSSLCALSDMSVTTRHTTADMGTKLVFDHKGLIVSRMSCARQPGTTVSLSNLFSTLPVRQKEFHRNLKREFNKMTQLLYAYCLVAEGVKIHCTNQVNKGQKSTVVATHGGSVKDNIACIFGVKQAQALLDLTPVYPESYVENIKETFFNNLDSANTESLVPKDDENDKPLDVSNIRSDTELELSEDSNDAQESTNNCTLQTSLPSQSVNIYDTPASSQQSTSSSPARNDNNIKKKPFDFHGYISSCAHGSGRSSKDRQFFYVNSRPCEPSKIMKLINEIYKTYNPHQAPFIYMNLKMKRSSVDVNVTPDKRKLFFDREKHLMEVVKTSLNKLYESIPSTLKIENIKNDNSNTSSNVENMKSVNAPRIFTSFLSQFSNKSQSNVTSTKTNSKSLSESKRKATSTLDNFVSKITKLSDDNSTNNDDDEYKDDSDVEEEKPATNLSIDENFDDVENDAILDVKYDIKIEDCELVGDNNKEINIEKIPSKSEESKETVFLGFSDNVPLSQVVDISEVINENNDSMLKTSLEKSKATKKSSNKKNVSVIVDSNFEKVSTERRSVKINVSLEEIKLQMFENYRIKEENKDTLEKVKFRTEINPVHNKKCEEELRKEISKDMFSQMKVIGQFNLGFIITQLENDLFIIDQHATDEKYNFETLQKTTVLTNQRLVVPQSLELTGVNERVLMDSLEVFRVNGFTFQIDEDAPPTKRVKLLTIPISKGIVFGKEDIDELLFMLQDCPNEVCRPSRVRAMFASRACRKSVMIGTALSKADMRRLVDHMGTLEQPWNCPHGRPTIRHLINMALIKNPD